MDAGGEREHGRVREILRYNRVLRGVRLLPHRNARRDTPSSLSNAQIAFTSAALSAWSPWRMLMRNASAPSRNSLWIISGVALAEPSVASTRTFRARGAFWIIGCKDPA
jgi:hypothetical protein